MIYAGVPSFRGLRLADGQVPTVLLLAIDQLSGPSVGFGSLEVVMYTYMHI